jgi:hypothetical protein
MEAPDSVDSYVLCVDDGGYPESLEVRKLYAVLPDERAAANDYIRVIDETGEDYLYPAKYFDYAKCYRQIPTWPASWRSWK